VNSDSEYAHGDIGFHTLVASFGDRENAHEAAKDLRDEGFHKIWIGVILGDATIKSEDDSLGAKVGRFFTGELDGVTLTDTLTRHGVSEEEAQRIQGTLEPDDVVLTVNGSNHPELAARVIGDRGGEILSGKALVYTTVEWTTAQATHLRNERLLSGNVPIIREDLFIMTYDEDDAERTHIRPT
jgi:hypothetical protein